MRHAPGAKDGQAACFDLTPAKSYDSLVNYGKPSLIDQVQHGYRQSFSKPGEGPASTSPLLALLSAPAGHYEVKLGTGLFHWKRAAGQPMRGSN